MSKTMSNQDVMIGKLIASVDNLEKTIDATNSRMKSLSDKVDGLESMLDKGTGAAKTIKVIFFLLTGGVGLTAIQYIANHWQA